ncbi:dienelactone hydrolase family protein [Xanthobacter autotrophicus]|jgi:carboxymethylenebutenolidase|uniref:Dienelactone hydrolase family protein n=1 Tax=Xanthobacter autotrophicus TaxID=280 RepID=A0A6C1KBY1_XANAU|nr:dienelactone hydrolase family protein [Xanthobacter autotrophicus]TLX41632.1 dienelactone hydrolase family protein [Xanthobacter autotrophicus]
MIEVTANEVKFSAYRADPEGTPKGAVVVLQDVFGVNADIRKIADDFAAAGYVAVAPSLFDKVKSNIELDASADAEGRSLTAELGTEWPIEAIQATVDTVKGAGKVALVGYSWGGYLAYLAANKVTGLACAIGYHADGLLEGVMEKRRIPTLIHFAEQDPLVSEEDRIQFRARRPDVSAFSYPDATRGFGYPAGPAYQAEAAEKAQERTLFWISQYVVGQGPVLLKNAGAYAQAKTEKKGKKKADDDMGPPVD